MNNNSTPTTNGLPPMGSFSTNAVENNITSAVAPTIGNSMNQNNKHKKKKKVVVIIIGVIIISILVALVLFFIIFNKKNDKKDTDKSVTQVAEKSSQNDDDGFAYNGIFFDKLTGYDYKTDNKVVSIMKKDKTEMYLLSLVKYRFSDKKENDFVKQIELDGYVAENIKKEQYNTQEIMTAEITNDEGNKFIAFLVGSVDDNYSFYGIAVKNQADYDYNLIKNVQKIISAATVTDDVVSQSFSKESILSKYKMLIQTVDIESDEELEDENQNYDLSGISANSVDYSEDESYEDETYEENNLSDEGYEEDEYYEE